MLCFLASSSRAKKALSLILKDRVTVFSGTFNQTKHNSNSSISILLTGLENLTQIFPVEHILLESEFTSLFRIGPMGFESTNIVVSPRLGSLTAVEMSTRGQSNNAGGLFEPPVVLAQGWTNTRPFSVLEAFSSVIPISTTHYVCLALNS